MNTSSSGYCVGDNTLTGVMNLI